jgi:mRNA interferase MazF
MKQTFTKEDVIDVHLGNPPQEVKGHEQALLRPCVVIKSFNNLGLAVIVPLTTSEPRYGLFTIVKIAKGQGGLTEDSFALCHQIRTISFDRILSKRGMLDTKNMLKIHAVLLDTLEL